MKRLLIPTLSVLAGLFVLRLAFDIFLPKIETIYVCRPEEPLVNCRNYYADIRRDTMDGSYVMSMYDPASSAAIINFEPISYDSSYKQGCWLGRDEGPNRLQYSTCQSSVGEWIVLEAPIRRVF